MLCPMRAILFSITFSHFSSHKKLDDDNHISGHVVEHTIHGNAKTALNLLNTSKHSGVPLSLHSPVSQDDSTWLVLDELKKKHLVGRPASSEVLLPPPSHDSTFHPVVFDVLDGVAIHSAALWTKAAGPSGLDAYGWRHLCTSFQGVYNDLYISLASVTRNLCTSYVDPAGITALVGGCLIVLYKCPGIPCK